MIFVLITALISYFIGNFNLAIHLSTASGRDIRQIGSGNAGTTNMIRAYGIGKGILVLATDTLKGVIAVVIGQYLAIMMIATSVHPLPLPEIAAISVLLGHTFPIFHGFRGGKGVAAMLGIALTLNWVLAIAALAAFAITLLITRYVSLGAILAAPAFIAGEIAYIGFDSQAAWIANICLAAIVILVVAKHRDNIKRILQGSESKFSFKRE